MFVLQLWTNITNGKYPLLASSLDTQVLYLFTLVLSIITYLFNPSHFVQSIFVYGMLAFSTYNYISYVTKVSRQMANILGIRIFHLDAEKLKRNN